MSKKIMKIRKLFSKILKPNEKFEFFSDLLLF